MRVHPQPVGAHRQGRRPLPVGRAGGRATADEVYQLDGKEPTYRGEFWVFAEREGDGVRSVSLELLGKARRLADSLGEKVGAVLPCERPAIGRPA